MYCVDLHELDLPECIKLEQTERLCFRVEIRPLEGPYRAALIPFSLRVPLTYPFQAPKLRCLRRLLHPSIDQEGNVCLNILRLDWSPVLSLNVVIWGLLALLLEPEAEEPLNQEAGRLLQGDPREFDRILRMTLHGGQYKDQTYDNVL